MLPSSSLESWSSNASATSVSGLGGGDFFLERGLGLGELLRWVVLVDCLVMVLRGFLEAGMVSAGWRWWWWLFWLMVCGLVGWNEYFLIRLCVF